MKLFYCFILFIPNLLFADRIGQNCPFEIYSINKEFKLKSIPFSPYGNDGISYMINSKSQDTVYVSNYYFKDEITIDETGNFIVSINSRPGRTALSKIDGLKFFNKGKLLKTFKISELITDTSNFHYSISHFSWECNSKIEKSIFSLLLSNKKVVEFNLSSGEKRKIYDLDSNHKIFFDKRNEKQITYINHPKSNLIPKLNDSTTFFEKINEKINIKIYDDKISDSDSSFYLKIRIDENGQGKLIIDVYEDELMKYYFNLSQEKIKIISDFIEQAIFLTSEIPIETKKWTFSTWVYILN